MRNLCAQFARSGDLKSHIPTHTEEKPNKCDTRGDQCASGCILNIRTHTGANPDKCTT